MTSTNKESLGSNTGSRELQEPQHSKLHMVRARVDSDGSTRGAFYHHGPGRIATKGNNTDTTTPPRRREGRRRRQKKGHALPAQPEVDVTVKNQTSLAMSAIEPMQAYTNISRLPSAVRGSLQYSSYFHVPSVYEDTESIALNIKSSTHQSIGPTLQTTTLPPEPPLYRGQQQQQQSISMFSAMAQSYPKNENTFEAMALSGFGDIPPPSLMYPSTFPHSEIPSLKLPRVSPPPLPDFVADPMLRHVSPLGKDGEQNYPTSWWERIAIFLDPTDWLLADMKHDDDGEPYFDEITTWNFAGWFRHLIYNPEVPEFTSLQQFSWALILGVIMGFYTALWKGIIEACVHFVWNTLPSQLFLWGFFTNRDGSFPLAHYMWIIPTLFGGVLSFIFAKLPTQIPGQNEWIHAVHSRGVQDHETFWALFGLSTVGMASGMSLGPELPLVLTAGMFGSYVAVLCKQSMLQARVMNLTAASAAVAGFFGFPMAGAMFVLEIPHRMGLQYFEALSPATISSIVAVLANRIVTGDDVTGYYKYPFLTETLPSHVFTSAIVYGLFGSGIGIGYAKGVLRLKHFVHDMFSPRIHNQHSQDKTGMRENKELNMQSLRTLTTEIFEDEETTPLVKRHRQEHPMDSVIFSESTSERVKRALSFGIADQATRAAVAGTLAGFGVGITCMFVPHVMFWGEAQLQNMIDKGRTPLPIFGVKGTPSSGLTAYGLCMTHFDDEVAVAAGFHMGCSALITVSKIFVTGLSLGTGIVGGHFWGPLFVGCTASHFLTDFVNLVSQYIGFGASLSAYPCVAILCVMGATHVVTFRAHMAIMLILTLTISAFDNGNSPGGNGGDYSAVFPLLVVSVFVSLMLTRATVFYSAQRSRGDIMAIGEVLCEPNKEGAPLVLDYEYTRSTYDDDGDDDNDDKHFDSDVSEPTYSMSSKIPHENHSRSPKIRTLDSDVTQVDIERAFVSRQSTMSIEFAKAESGDKVVPLTTPTGNSHNSLRGGLNYVTSQPNKEKIFTSAFNSVNEGNKSSNREVVSPPSSRLDELLARPMEAPIGRDKKPWHRRIQSASDVPRGESSSSNAHRRTSSVIQEPPAPERLVQVASFGEISDYQPSLMKQARMRASSSVGMTHRRLPSLPNSGRHSRKNSDGSLARTQSPGFYTPASSDASASLAFMSLMGSEAAGALPQDEIERNFSSAMMLMGAHHRRVKSRDSSNSFY